MRIPRATGSGTPARLVWQLLNSELVPADIEYVPRDET
jgi:hypothetical protein